MGNRFIDLKYIFKASEQFNVMARFSGEDRRSNPNSAGCYLSVCLSESHCVV